MQLDGVAFDEHRLERLDSHAMKRRRAVEKHRVIADHLFEDIPHFIVLALQHLLCTFDRIGVTQLFQPADNERLIQLQRDLLWESALMQLEAWPDHNYAARGVI